MPDSNAIDAALKLVNRELWIVTAQAEQGRGGLLATWVSSASIDREHPVMLVGLAPQHHTRELVDASGHFGLHLISAEQLPLAFAMSLGSGRTRDKLQGLSLHTAVTGAPLLADCVAWFDCRVFARLETGSRIFYWADVQAGAKLKEVAPACEHDLFAAATPEQRQGLIADRDANVAVQRPADLAWRAALPPYLAPPGQK